MSRIHSFSLLLLSLLFISCNDSNRQGDINSIEEAKERWKSNNLSDYRIEVERSCFCAAPFNYTAVVENNEVVRIIDTETGESVGQTGGYPTIDELFSWLEQVAPKKPEKLDLEFHPTLGYPTFIDYNQSDLIADEELLMKIDNLKTE